MLVLLPPSETKSDGGSGVLDHDLLGFAALKGRRRTAAAALRRLPLRDAPALLGLGARVAHEASWNRALNTGPVRPAIERYTGVLYDGLDVAGLGPDELAWLHENVVIGSALFGLVRAGDPIPRYRLSGSSPVPGLPLKAHWREAVSAALAATGEWILDARSEAYVALGPAPAGSAVLHVETTDGRALNHFNKRAKGELVRALAQCRPFVSSRAELLDWSGSAGVALEPRGAQDLVLRV